MTTRLDAQLLDSKSVNWSAHIDELRSRLGAPHNPELFPPHFLKSTFPKIGGRVVVFRDQHIFFGAGFLFPRALTRDIQEFTLRFHKANADVQVTPQEMTDAAARLVGKSNITFYEPTKAQFLQHPAHTRSESVKLDRPNLEQAQSIRALQQQIWQSQPDDLYPFDIHASNFNLATSLIATSNGAPVGFLFGFYKFGGSNLPAEWQAQFSTGLRVESQVMGVLPGHRNHSIGLMLKKQQSENALREGIPIVNWTVDPLQYANAVLNFGRLKAIAFDHYPDHHPFRNALNQVTASRFGITWLIPSKRVKEACSVTQRATIWRLTGNSTIPRISLGETVIPTSAPPVTIAIEIPSDWNSFQNRNPQMAQIVRDRTDRFFQNYLGYEQGKYIITGVGEDGDLKYLIAERVSKELLERLSA
ncbi:MAG: hypothetical protein FJ009_03440 [Chloroflexi bacterium]|nr:hypothetical protein [Chloroflexota bacterium]